MSANSPGPRTIQSLNMSRVLPFSRVLVANRGEIAVRICRSLKDMGIVSVAVHSDVDAQALHVLAADETVLLAGQGSGSYLEPAHIVAAAQQARCEAVHPGYGFLSEDPALPSALVAAGLVFIGPSAAAMEALGSKRRAKEVALAANVPVVPGFDTDDGDEEALQEEARKIGYPVLIKAVGGGGGKGMRLVEQDQDFAEAIAACRREAQSAFGSGDVLLERCIRPARHVEIQVLGDSQGRVVALNERECSVQRRHQKIIEEAPSPAVNPELRQRMMEAAVRLAEGVKYQNAGTVEFLLDPEGSFYFLEMNTRLQVEHPVTEMTTGLDLVQLQVYLAGGSSLRELLGDRDLSPRGHSIEARVYAEDPAAGFLPAAGVLSQVIEPRGPGVRIDSGVCTGSEVTVHFDPMLAKIIVHDADRASALSRMRKTLAESAYLGVSTNLDFLDRVFQSEEFQAGELSTDMLDRSPALAEDGGGQVPNAAYAGAALFQMLAVRSAPGDGSLEGLEEPWTSLGAIRLWEGA